MYKVLTGNEAAAYAAMNCKVRFVAAYPITPATSVVEMLSRFIDEGRMKAKFVHVESEHSAMAACIGASAGGLRVFTATSSQGLAYMHEMLHWAANARTPVVMTVANRALAPGWNIWADQSDSLSQRDTGWLQFYCGNVQEIYDTIAMAYRIAESKEVMLPAMVCYDGFVLSHVASPVEVSPLNGFIDEYEPQWRISIDNPFTHGNVCSPEYYFSLRKSVHKAHEKALKIIPKIEQEFFECTGRYTTLLYDTYKIEDAKRVIVAMGAIAMEAKIAVDILRKRGEKVGLLRLRSFRPFPVKSLRSILVDKEVCVIDRNLIPGVGGVLHQEITASLKKDVDSLILGVGGADVTAEMIAKNVGRLILEVGR